ncbi:CBL-interacting serine threonine- kinase 3-like [Olea europaea subsp. europaea]|uniref:CBL-interacting serine threonine- kinase 3-like n=1 Tax=Olea europaea subsp. europaea TaxID=158383 RepID=A0A8S0Q502_OLEEU|nr:CBL-interacting serine threonine- kinase 3-like [Olea europaea subsp. europaea]
MRLENVKAGRKGNLNIVTEVFQVAPSLHMVEVRKAKGDTLEFHKRTTCPPLPPTPHLTMASGAEMDDILLSWRLGTKLARAEQFFKISTKMSKFLEPREDMLVWVMISSFLGLTNLECIDIFFMVLDCSS